MIRFYKVYLLLAFLVGVPVGVLLVLLIVSPKGENLVLAFATMVLWVLLWVLFLNAQATKKYNRLMDVLLQQCNPQLFLQQIAKLAYSAKTHNMQCINKSAAYINMGMLEEARQALAGTRPFKANYGDIVQTAAYLNNQAYVCALMGDFVLAQDFLRQFQLMLGKPAAKHRQEALYLMYLDISLGINVMCGLHDGAEFFYLNKINCVQNMLGRVYGSWMLAKVYLAQNRPAQARPLLQFVANNGGGTFYRSTAIHLLAGL